MRKQLFYFKVPVGDDARELLAEAADGLIRLAAARGWRIIMSSDEAVRQYFRNQEHSAREYDSEGKYLEVRFKVSDTGAVDILRQDTRIGQPSYYLTNADAYPGYEVLAISIRDLISFNDN